MYMYILHILLMLCLHVVVRIGFNETVYTVLESDRVASVFVAVLEGDLQRRVSVTFSTNANTTTGK